MKYDSQLLNLKAQVPSIKKALIAIPQNASIDKLAAALSLSLALKQSGKEVTVICSDSLTVSQSHLFGIGDIQTQIPAQSEGNYVLSLAGVVDQNGMVPALAGLDWYPDGQNLNLVFKINPGQKFEPKEIAAKQETSGGFNMIFVVGASALVDLGSIYQNNANVFSQTPLVNIDNSSQNGNFGWTNVVDSGASLSEMMVTIISSLGFLIDADMATNILNGIYQSTANLTQNVTADTFMAAGLALQSGGRLPASSSIMSEISQTQVPPIVQPQIIYPQAETSIVNQEVQTPAPIVESTPVVPVVTEANPNPAYDLSKIFGITPNQAESTITNPEPIVTQPVEEVSNSQQETPVGEVAVTPSVENPANPTPDWLVPKIYSGKSGGGGLG